MVVPNKPYIPSDRLPQTPHGGSPQVNNPFTISQAPFNPTTSPLKNPFQPNLHGAPGAPHISPGVGQHPEVPGAPIWHNATLVSAFQNDTITQHPGGHSAGGYPSQPPSPGGYPSQPPSPATISTQDSSAKDTWHGTHCTTSEEMTTEESSSPQHESDGSLELKTTWPPERDHVSGYLPHMAEEHSVAAADGV
jgi:hypothetical protein